MKKDALAVELEAMLPPVKAATSGTTPEAKAELLRWSSGQLKLRGHQLKAAKTKLNRLVAKATLYAGRKALVAHRNNAERYVTKLENYLNNLEKIHAEVAPKVQL